jgi:hypothetical protein
MRSAVDRMLTRMRSAQEVRFAIKWNAIEEKHKTHEWASTLPPQLIDGETVHLFARLPAKTEKPPVLICKTLVKDVEQEVSSAKPTSITWDTEGIVARLCAAAQIGELTEGKADTKLAKSLAMKYQLVTQHTNLFLLHERAEENKADGLPQLQQVAQMQAAGFGGYGSLTRAAPALSVMRTGCNSEAFAISECLSASALGGDYGRLNTPSVWRTNRTHAASKVDGMASAGMDDIEIPAFLRKQAPTLDEMIQSSKSVTRDRDLDTKEVSVTNQLFEKVKDWIKPIDKKSSGLADSKIFAENPSTSFVVSLEEITKTLNMAAMQSTSFRIALRQVLRLNLPHEYAQPIIELTKLTNDSATSWALLLNWLLTETEKFENLEKHAQRLIRDQMKKVDPSTIGLAIEIFKKHKIEAMISTHE